MKIKTCDMPYEKVLEQPGFRHKNPVRQNPLFRKIMKLAALGDLKATDFTYEMKGMEQLGKSEPCMILMNHSSFIDLKIIFKLFASRQYHIVCTYDGFVGKRWIMEQAGCIPTTKFRKDLTLVKDILYAVKKLNSSVLMYPEASYTFDGTQTPLPSSIGKLLKLLEIPVVMVKTEGAFARDPLYNGLQLRKVKVSATVEYLLSPSEIREKSAEELNEILKEQFTYDHFRWQQENHIKITESFRADYLNRVLYHCPHCNAEGQMEGKGIMLTCKACGKTYTLTEEGYLQAADGKTEFPHIPDWYAWERQCVREELEAGTYQMDLPVDIYMMVNTDCVYRVGTGRLRHDREGFRLTGCDGKLDYVQKPQASYSLYSDYFWYEIGDMICIGDGKAQYYCFPQNAGDVAAKARLATEELYKLTLKTPAKAR